MEADSTKSRIPAWKQIQRSNRVCTGINIRYSMVSECALDAHPKESSAKNSTKSKNKHRVKWRAKRRNPPEFDARHNGLQSSAPSIHTSRITRTVPPSHSQRKRKRQSLPTPALRVCTNEACREAETGAAVQSGWLGRTPEDKEISYTWRREEADVRSDGA